MDFKWLALFSFVVNKVCNSNTEWRSQFDLKVMVKVMSFPMRSGTEQQFSLNQIKRQHSKLLILVNETHKMSETMKGHDIF